MAQDMTAAYDALRQAHAAGDRKSAQKIAEYIRAQGSGRAPTEGVQPVDVDVASGLARTVSDWFSPKEPEPVTPGQLGSAVAGGAAAGAVGGAVLPGIVKSVGRFIPGPVGKIVTGLGEAMSALPLKERVIRGAGGGAGMAGVEEGGKALGAPTAVTTAAGLIGGGVGETAASFLTKEATKLAHFVGNVSYGNVAGASRALGGMLSPNKPLNEATAAKLQQKLFGQRTEGYVDGLVGSDNRIATQQALRKADPSLSQPLQDGTRPMWDTSTGEMEPMSGSRDLAARKPASSAGAGGSRPALPAPEGGLPGSFARGKAGAQAKRAAARAEAERLAAEQSLKPVSQIYRERMFAGVTKAVQEGKTFSTTPEFADFQEMLASEVRLGNISKSDYQGLMRTLTSDRLKNPRVQAGYAEAVDDRIREWGKQLEGKPSAGAAAVSAKTATDVRTALRQAYNQYTSRIGLGDIETKYRNAYSQEMLAEAKDKLPHFLYGFSSGPEFAKMAKSLARDPQGLPFIQSAVAKHLANTPPKDIASEFERLQQVLVNAKLVQPADLKDLRTGAAAVKRTTDKGLKLRASQQLSQMLLMAMARQGGISAGAAAGRPTEAEEE